MSKAPPAGSNGITPVVILLGVLFLLLKLAWLALRPNDASIFELGFGYGSYIDHLYHGGEYKSTDGGVVDYSTRMPVIPLFYTALALLAKSQVGVAVLKDVIVSIGAVAALICLFRLHRPRGLLWPLIFLLLILSPPVIKHAAVIDYEEGLLIELLVVYAVSLCVYLKSSAAGRPAAGALVIATATVTLGLLTKVSLLPLYAATLALCALHAWRQRSAAVVAAALIALLALGLWGLHNYASGGRFALTTSWNGEVLYRGNSTQSLRLYPYITLDRITDTRVATLPTGETVEMPRHRPRAAFADEWAWNDYYREQSLRWAEQHPGLFWRFLGRKAYNFFIGIERTPYTVSANAYHAVEKPVENAAVMLWLAAGRAALLATLLLCGYFLMCKSTAGRLYAAAFLALTVCYALPYLVGFNVERHVTPYLCMTCVCLCFLLEAYAERRQGRDARPPA